MPGVDLWRFILPEHRQFVVSRHSAGETRQKVIQRGFFNGMGWVVWQDIFGLVLAWTPSDAALLKKCRTLMRTHRDAFSRAHPTPLVEPLQPGVYANEFVGENGRLWTFYNETERHTEGPTFCIELRPHTRLVDIWNGADIELQSVGTFSLSLEACSVGAAAEVAQ